MTFTATYRITLAGDDAMRRKSWFVLAALLAGVAVVHAQSSAVGTWKGENGSGVGPPTVTVVINADGTGTFNAGNDNALSGIVIEGDTVSFSFKPVGAGGTMTMNMVGKVDGDTLTLRGTIAGGAGGPGPPLVLSRQK
jgi:hypothetical protein